MTPAEEILLRVAQLAREPIPARLSKAALLALDLEMFAAVERNAEILAARRLRRLAEAETWDPALERAEAAVMLASMPPEPTDAVAARRTELEREAPAAFTPPVARRCQCTHLRNRHPGASACKDCGCTHFRLQMSQDVAA